MMEHREASECTGGESSMVANERIHKDSYIENQGGGVSLARRETIRSLGRRTDNVHCSDNTSFRFYQATLLLVSTNFASSLSPVASYLKW